MRQKIIIIVCLIFCLLNGGRTRADSLSVLLDEAERRNLAGDPVWLQLLHYDDNRSEILTDSFFLSPHGRDDPGAELSATIKAFFDPWEDTDSHARCRFPARYFWLSKQLPLPDYTMHEPGCERLQRWSLFDRVESISLFLVSGYFGNPASTFGHALLKFNTDSPDDPTGHFDLTINYGALIPENESTIRYVIRGLFGGYEAGFSDQYFYTQDLVYSRTEFRDIWDYRLNLSDDQRTLLILHIWEIIGKKFTYFFLNENCVYRLGELLEMATGEVIVDNAHMWYIPVELFHRLNEIDGRRHLSGKPALIQSVRFIPSSQRTLHHQFSRLTKVEVRSANAIIQEGPSIIPDHLSMFPPDRRAEILDAVIAYHQYRLIAAEPAPGDERREIRDHLLLARLRLPPTLEPPPQVPAQPSPTHGTRPMATGIGIARKTGGDKLYWQMHWAAFTQEFIGQNSLESGELAILDTAIGVDDDFRVFVDKLDIVRALKLDIAPVAVVDESRWSWQLKIGATRTNDNGKMRHDGMISFGLGRAWRWNTFLVWYAMSDIAAHSLKPNARLRPHTGLFAGAGSLRAWGYIGAETEDYDGGLRDVWGGNVQYRLSEYYAIYMNVSNETSARASIGINRYW